MEFKFKYRLQETHLEPNSGRFIIPLDSEPEMDSLFSQELNNAIYEYNNSSRLDITQPGNITHLHLHEKCLISSRIYYSMTATGKDTIFLSLIIEPEYHHLISAEMFNNQINILKKIISDMHDGLKNFELRNDAINKYEERKQKILSLEKELV